MTFLIVFAGTVVSISYFNSKNPFYVAHDAGANIKVWLDADRDGKRDNDEPFLPNVCVWAGYASSFQSLGTWQKICHDPYFVTDSGGTWSEFFAGGRCGEIYNAIHPPENYFPTTPTIVNGCSAEFGLSQGKPLFEIQSPIVEQYLQQEKRKEITIFRTKIGLAIISISVFAGFVSLKITRPVKSEAGQQSVQQE